MVETPWLRKQRGVALVFPYFRTRARTEVLFPPLGPALLSAHLKKAGVGARVFDGTFSSFDELIDDLVAWRPAIVGISAMVSLTGNALRIAAAVRERLPDALLVAGGPLPTVFPDRFLPHVDVVFRGEADTSFPAFCRDYLERRATPATLGDLPLAEYAGLVADAGGARVANAPVHHSQEEIAAYPLPDRDDFDHRAYQREWAPTGYRPTTLLATLGCPYDCEFCSKPVFGNAVRRRPLDAVMAEIDDIVRLGYDGLWIADDTFTLHRDYLEEFCRRVAPLGLTWSCLSRANGIDPVTAGMMRAAGCRRVYLGLESGSQATLDLMQKQMTVAAERARRERVQRGGHRGGGLLHRRLPGRERGRHRGDLRVRARACRSRRSPSTCRCRCRARGCGSGWAAASPVATGRTRTRSRSSSARRSTRAGCGGVSTRR